MQNKTPFITPALISAFSELSSQDAETSRNELFDWIATLKKEIEENGSVIIETLGTFTNNEGDLSFEPEQEFELNLNIAYNGLEPVDLQRAGKALGIEQMEDLELIGEALSEEAQSPDIEQPTAKLPQPEAQPDKKEQHGSDEQKKKIPAQDIKQDIKPATGKTLLKSPSKSTKPDKPKIKKPPVKASIQRKSASNFTGAIVTATIILIATTVFLIYHFQNSRQSSTNQADPNVIFSPNVAWQQDEDSLAEELQNIGDGAVAGNSSVSKPANVPAQAQKIEAGEDNAVFGLRGALSPAINEFYTIVIHSVQFEANAIREKIRLANMGYRVAIEQAEVNGTTTFRVGIGQFETLEDAKRASQSLPSSVNSYFFKRFNLN